MEKKIENQRTRMYVSYLARFIHDNEENNSIHEQTDGLKISLKVSLPKRQRRLMKSNVHFSRLPTKSFCLSSRNFPFIMQSMYGLGLCLRMCTLYPPNFFFTLFFSPFYFRFQMECLIRFFYLPPVNRIIINLMTFCRFLFVNSVNT